MFIDTRVASLALLLASMINCMFIDTRVASLALLLASLAHALPSCPALFPSYPGGVCGTSGSNQTVTAFNECPPNSLTTAAGATNVTQCMCIPGYQGAVDITASPTSCSICPAGTYSPDGQGCIACGPGTYSIATGQTNSSTCLSCPAGSFCSSPSANPVACLQGSYCPVSSTMQSPCPAGWYCNSSAVAIRCPEGSSCSTGSTAPVACPAGTLCTGNNTAPSVCPQGSFCSSGSSREICPPNFFCADGVTAASPCPPPSVTWGTGGTSYLSCQCPLGMYGRVTSPTVSSCASCPMGQFCPAVAVQCGC